MLIKHGEMIVANLGDGRAVASVLSQPRQLTQDHNTSNPRERERVAAMGGVIKDNRVGGVLIPTRYIRQTEIITPRRQINYKIDFLTSSVSRQRS